MTVDSNAWKNSAGQKVNRSERFVFEEDPCSLLLYPAAKQRPATCPPRVMISISPLLFH